MITQNQIKELAADFKVDEFTVFREYLQLLFLSYLYRNRKAAKIYFKGGTAIHFFLGSPRFSEDLDFSTDYPKEEIKKIIKEVKEEIKKELWEIEISLLYQGEKSIRFRLKYQPSDFKYPLTIRIDFNEMEKPKKVIISPLVTRFPVAFFPLISHFSPEEILAEKVRAFLLRAKGRDLFDLWFLLEKGIKWDQSLIEQKMREVGGRFEKGLFLGKIKNYSLKKLKLDLGKFLSEPQRRIMRILKKILLEKVK